MFEIASRAEQEVGALSAENTMLAEGSERLQVMVLGTMNQL